MRQLGELTARHVARRAAHFERLRALAEDLNHTEATAPDPTPEPILTSRSTESESSRSTSDEEHLRSLLPRRTTPGGDYGRSILARVAESYQRR